MTDPAYQIIFGGFAFRDGQDFDGVVVVVGAQNEAISGKFDVADGASIVFQNSVHIQFALAIGLE